MVSLRDVGCRLTSHDMESMDVGTLSMLHMLRRDVRRSSAMPLLYGRRGIYAIVVPEAMDPQAYAVSDAINTLLMTSVIDCRSTRDFRVVEYDNNGWSVDFDQRRGSGALRALQRMRTKHRRIVFVGKMSDFSMMHVDVRALIECYVDMSERPTVQHLRGAMVCVFGNIVTDSDVSHANRGDVELWSACMPAITNLRHALEQLDAVLAARAAEAVADVTKPDQPTVDLSEAPSLDDLHGLGEAGDWARQLIEDLAAYGRGELPWSEIDRGALLSGPPGCGKTTFARSLAKSAGVKLIATSVTNWMTPAKGDGSFALCAREMKNAFLNAKMHSPCILFVDELDAIGDREAFTRDNNHRWMHDFCNAFLECLDGFESRTGVVVIGATNFPDSVDAAVRRSGRLDRHIRIPLPDAEARVSIMKWYLRGAADDLDLSPLANRTNGLSGADLEKACRGSRRIARRDGGRSVTIDDLAAELPAIHRVSDEIVSVCAHHEAGHAVVCHVLDAHEIIEVGIAREIVDGAYGQAGGGFICSMPPMGNMSREQLLDEITILLAGIAAEEIIIGRRYTGSGGSATTDLVRATSIAATIHGVHGLGQQLSVVGLLDDDTSHLLRFPDIRRAVEETLQDCLARARDIITEHRDAVEEIARLLVERGFLNGTEVAEIVDRQPRLRLINH